MLSAIPSGSPPSREYPLLKLRKWEPHSLEQSSSRLESPWICAAYQAKAAKNDMVFPFQVNRPWALPGFDGLLVRLGADGRDELQRATHQNPFSGGVKTGRDAKDEARPFAVNHTGRIDLVAGFAKPRTGSGGGIEAEVVAIR